MTPLVVGLLVAVAVLVRPGRTHGPAFPRPRRSESAFASLRRPGRRVARRRPGDSELAVTAETAELLALCLSAGLGPEAALDLAAGSTGGADPRRDGLIALLREDDPGPSVPVTGHSRGAGLLGVAWWMSRERGSPLGAVVSTCGRTLRAEDAAERRRRAAEAGPRASMWLLTALPVIGPGLAALAGVDVVAAYSAPVAIVSCTVGVILTGAGWCWARRLLRTAARPVRHG